MTYAYARIDGALVGAVGGGAGVDREPSWTSYVAVASVDETTAAAEAAGARVLDPPDDTPQGTGRVAVVTDPGGARLGFWQAGTLVGAELVNADGAWNFSDLVTSDLTRAQRFYGDVLRWRIERFAPDDDGGMWALAGYGAHLAELDPETYTRVEEHSAPTWFPDVVASCSVAPDAASDRWGTTFGVTDVDASFARAAELGATVVVPLFDTDYTRMGVVRDPQGADITLSEFRPPTGA